jgi:hypothetical protein
MALGGAPTLVDGLMADSEVLCTIDSRVPYAIQAEKDTANAIRATILSHQALPYFPTLRESIFLSRANAVR